MKFKLLGLFINFWRNNMKMKKLLLVLITLTLPLSGLADIGSPDFSQKGPYVGVSAGVPVLFVSQFFGNGWNSSRGKFGVNLNAGYEFNQYFALETSANIMNYSDTDPHTITFANLSAKLMLPLDQSAKDKLFVKAGPSLNFKSGKSRVIAYFAGGYEHRFTEQLAFDAQVEDNTFIFVNATLFSVGLNYYF